MMHHTNDPDDDEALPRDLDDFLATLTRRLAALDPDGLMQCASRRCHRARRCIEADVRCHAPESQPPMTEDQRAEMIAELNRQLRARIHGSAHADPASWEAQSP
jgi:hypothetical protein